MIPSTNYDQGNARAASGDSLCGMGRTPARIVGRNQSQFRHHPVADGRLFSIFPLTPLLTWPGDLARKPGLFHSIARRSLTAEHKRGCSSKGLRWRLAIPSRLAGRPQLCRADYVSRPTVPVDVAHHVCQDKSDTPHRHVVNPLDELSFQRTEHAAIGGQIIGYRSQFGAS